MCSCNEVEISILDTHCVMREYFRILPMTGLSEGATLYRPVQPVPERVTLETPALEAMTDLRHSPALTIEADASVDAANARMIWHGVRLLFITDLQEHILGLITATDILSEKVVQTAQDQRVPREEVLVRDIMTPRERLEAIDIEELRGAKVGHVLSTLQRAGRQHVIVVEVHEMSFHDKLVAFPQANPLQTVRGLFSATQIARQLGIGLHTPGIATTFAELEALLTH